MSFYSVFSLSGTVRNVSASTISGLVGGRYLGSSVFVMYNVLKCLNTFCSSELKQFASDITMANCYVCVRACVRISVFFYQLQLHIGRHFDLDLCQSDAWHTLITDSFIFKQL